MKNEGIISDMVRRIFFEEPKKKEKKELTPLQIEFKEKCKKYPIIAVFTKYHGETPYFVGPPKFVRVRNIIDDELDIDPPHGDYLKTLPICEITNYNEVTKCYSWGKSAKVKFYQQV